MVELDREQIVKFSRARAAEDANRSPSALWTGLALLRHLGLAGPYWTRLFAAQRRVPRLVAAFRSRGLGWERWTAWTAASGLRRGRIGRQLHDAPTVGVALGRGRLEPLGRLSGDLETGLAVEHADRADVAL